LSDRSGHLEALWTKTLRMLTLRARPNPTCQRPPKNAETRLDDPTTSAEFDDPDRHPRGSHRAQLAWKIGLTKHILIWAAVVCVFPLVRSGACRCCRRAPSRGGRPRPPQTPAEAIWGSPHSPQGAVESPDLSFRARAVAQFTEPSTKVVVGRGGSNCSGWCPARLGHFDRPLGARCHFKTWPWALVTSQCRTRS